MANFTLSTGNVAVPSASATVTNGDTSSTIKVTASCYLTNGWVQSTGVVAKIYINGSLVATKTILGNGTSYTAPAVKTVTASKAITKTTSAQSIKWEVQFHQYTDGVAQGKKETLSGTASVTAKTKYTIKYHANGGTGTIADQTKWHGTAITLSDGTAFDKTGYAFQGWSTTTSGGVVYKARASYTANASDTLYAVWKAKTYTITYHVNGGTGTIASQTKTHGTAITLTTSKPTRANYTFLGWSTSSSATSATYTAGANFTSNANTTLYAVWKLSYVKPKITSLSVDRCISSAGTTLADTGTYALVAFDWTTSINNPTITIQWKLSTATSYPSANKKTITITDNTKNGHVGEVIGGGALNADSTYTIYIKVADTTSYSEVTRALSGQKFTIDRLTGGNGIAFGKPAELDNTMDVGFVGRFREDVMVGQKSGYQDGNQGVFLDREGFIHLQRSSEQGYHPYIGFYIDSAIEPDGSIRLNSTDKTLEFINAAGYKFDNNVALGRNSYIRMTNLSGVYRNIITWNDSNNIHFCSGPHDNSEGTTYYNGNVVYIKSKTDIGFIVGNANDTSDRPYYRKGDSITFGVHSFGGFVTSSAQSVRFFVPISKPVIGNPVVNVTATTTFLIRQNGKYTHGSTASVQAAPVSYSAAIRPGGVNIHAEFTDVTNAINNDACGVYWAGTITFS